MKFFKLEFKLLWKARLTWIVGIVALLLSILYAFAICNFFPPVAWDSATPYLFSLTK